MKKFIIIIASITLLTVSSNANFGSFGLVNAKSALMGNGGSAYSDGVYNLNLNPAAMVSPTDSSYFQFLFPGLDLNLQAYTNALPIEDFNYFFGGVNDPITGELVGRTLTEDDKNRLISNFVDGGQVGISSNVNWLSAGIYISDAVGGFAISASDHINFKTKVPESLVELVLKRNQPGQSYSFDDFNYSLSWIRSYGLTYSRKLITNGEGLFKTVNVGLTGKMYQGMLHSEMTISNSSFFTHVDDHQLDIAYTATQYNAYSDDLAPYINDEEGNSLPIMPSSGGSGMGIDIGFTAELDMGLVIGVSITDMGSFSWDANAEQRIISSNSSISDLTESEQLDSLVDSGDPVANKLSSLDGELPTALRVGFWLPVHKIASVPGELNLTLDYNQGFNDYAANSTSARIALGVDWKVFKYWPRILTGISNDPIGGMRWSMGLGYSPSFMDIYLGTHDILSAFAPNEHASVAFGIRWKLWN